MNDETPSPTQPEPLKAEQVLYLPGYLFFVDAVELPPALEADEIADFAEISIESIAPFPIEHLNWGFLHADGADSILIYAAHRDRIKKEGFEDLDAYAWVLPDFAGLIGARFPEATDVLLQNDEGISLLQFERGSEIPYNVASRPFAEGESEAAVKELRDGARPHSPPAPSLHIRPAGTSVSEKGLPTFEHAPFNADDRLADSGNWTQLSPAEKTLWQADVRSPAFKEAERNARRTGALFTRITAWTAILILVLIGLEVGLFAAQTWLGTLQAKIAAQEPTVARIEDKQSLMNKLEQVAQNELRPVAILEALNKVRPKGIYFTGTVAEGENRITIDGIANTINELNSYTETLSKSGNFELIGTPKSITRSGTTTFTVTLDYHHHEAAVSEQPEPIANPEPESEATEI